MPLVILHDKILPWLRHQESQEFIKITDKLWQQSSDSKLNENKWFKFTGLNDAKQINANPNL